MSLETLETKVDELATAFAEMRGEIKGKLHEPPCIEHVVAMRELRLEHTSAITELRDGHVRPLEDREERRRGVLWVAVAVGSLGAVLATIEAIRKWFQ